MENEIYNYTVDKKAEGSYRLKRILMITFYVAFFVGLFVAVLIIKIYPTFAVAPILTYILVLCTWRFVSIEYRYEVERGELRLYTVYGGKRKKQMGAFMIKTATSILPYEKANECIREFAPDTTYNLLSSQKSPSDPFALLLEKEGKRYLVLLEAPEISLKSILYYATDKQREQARG